MIYHVLGPQGTYTDLAYQSYKNASDEVFFHTSIDRVLKSIGHNEYAIVPIENILEGFIQPTLDNLLLHDLFIVDEVILSIDFSFIAHVEYLEEVKRIYVQFAAKNQCLEFLDQFENIDIVFTENNVESLSLLDEKKMGEAAIIPSHLLNMFHGFKIEHVSDLKENKTRFVVVSKTPQHIKSSLYRISCVVTPYSDRPGLLYDLLYKFKSRNINLTSILSRPTRKKMGSYHFFIDLMSKSEDLKMIKDVLSEINIDFEVKTLGVYPCKIST